MKLALLANDADGFVKPMAAGLARILERAGAHAQIYRDGLAQLTALPRTHAESSNPDPYRMLRRLARRTLVERPHRAAFAERFRAYDAVIVVNTLPDVFLRDYFPDATLRECLPDTPVVLYDLYYLPTRGHWWKFLRDGNPAKGIPEGNQWGMDRYDWYLCASVVSEVPMPPGNHPYSVVGLDLDDGTLYPEQNGEFVALIDFAQPGYERERTIQLEACEAAGVPYVVLSGRYPQADIRKIYRRSSVFFPAFRESFGLPICELQACGSYVCLAHGHWAPSHWIKSDLNAEGPGALSPNLVVYDNNKERLVQTLQTMKQTYDPQRVIHTFKTFHPQLFSGDTTEAGDFLNKLRTGLITARSHETYASMPVTEYAGRYKDQI